MPPVVFVLVAEVADALHHQEAAPPSVRGQRYTEALHVCADSLGPVMTELLNTYSVGEHFLTAQDRADVRPWLGAGCHAPRRTLRNYRTRPFFGIDALCHG